MKFAENNKEVIAGNKLWRINGEPPGRAHAAEGKSRGSERYPAADVFGSRPCFRPCRDGDTADDDGVRAAAGVIMGGMKANPVVLPDRLRARKVAEVLAMCAGSCSGDDCKLFAAQVSLEGVTRHPAATCNFQCGY